MSMDKKRASALFQFSCSFHFHSFFMSASIISICKWSWWKQWMNEPHTLEKSLRRFFVIYLCPKWNTAERRKVKLRKIASWVASTADDDDDFNRYKWELMQNGIWRRNLNWISLHHRLFLAIFTSRSYHLIMKARNNNDI